MIKLILLSVYLGLGMYFIVETLKRAAGKSLIFKIWEICILIFWPIILGYYVIKELNTTR